MRPVFTLATLLILSGCAAQSGLQTHRPVMSAEQLEKAREESLRKAEILKTLPVDADMENLEEQVRLHEFEQYVDIHGARRSLNEDVATKTLGAKKPARINKQEQRRPLRNTVRPAPEETLSFDPLPAPVDILGAGAR